MSRFWNLLCTMFNNVIQTEVHQVNCKLFLNFSCNYWRIFIICFFIIHFNASKLCIFEFSVYSHYINTNSMRFMGFKWWWNSQFSIFLIQNINILLFFHSSNHAGTTTRISCNILSWNYTTATSFSISFLVNLNKFLFIIIILQYNNPARVRCDNYKVLFNLY